MTTDAPGQLHDAAQEQAQLRSRTGRGVPYTPINPPAQHLTAVHIHHLLDRWDAWDTLTPARVIIILHDLGILGGMTDQELADALEARKKP